MRRRLAALAAITACLTAAPASASPQASADPIGDLLLGALTGAVPGSPQFRLKASLYHVGARGVGVLDSLGCRVVDRIDLFTGSGSASMKPIMGLNMSHLTVSKVGQFQGCPPA